MARILLIDDDDGFREILHAILTTAGHQVAQAVDGRQGLALARANAFDLVITDILMPECDGTETIIALRHQQPDLPVIAMSGASVNSTLYLRVAQSLGVRRTLTKPFTSKILLEMVDATVGITA